MNEKTAEIVKMLVRLYNDACQEGNLGEARRCTMDLAKIVGVYNQETYNEEFNPALAQMKDEDLDKLHAQAD